ncbi:hypothetical protein BJ742DRAFT_834842 [Cladochytrium replicatum]|nr:hypothetical protein BJ742DRAFT_834842 [Cladochytrium replicatum]
MSDAAAIAAQVKTDSEVHRYAGAIVAEISVFICFLESYQRIQNKHLKISITLFLIFSILVNVLFMTGTVLVSKNDFSTAQPMFIIGSICWVIAWLNVTYHTSYRAALISLVGFQRPWIVSIIAVACQAALSGTGSVFFTMNFLASFGTTVDPRSTTITFVESFWYSIVETALFVVTQYRIVSVRSRIKKVSSMVKFQLYMKAVTRSLLYSLNVIMMFLSVGNAFGAEVGGNWSVYGHAITLLILMTDSNRFQETIAILNGDTTGGGKRTGMTGISNTYGSQNASGHNHSYSGENRSFDKPVNQYAARRGNTQHSNSDVRSDYSGGTVFDTNAVFGTGAASAQLYNSPSRTPTYSNNNTSNNDLSQSQAYSSPARNYQAGAQYGNQFASGGQFGGAQGGQQYGGSQAGQQYGGSQVGHGGSQAGRY